MVFFKLNRSIIYIVQVNFSFDDYFYLLLKNKNDIIIAVKDRILQDKRVLNVNSIDVSFNNNLLSIEAELETTQGIINV